MFLSDRPRSPPFSLACQSAEADARPETRGQRPHDNWPRIEAVRKAWASVGAAFVVSFALCGARWSARRLLLALGPMLSRRTRSPATISWRGR